MLGVCIEVRGIVLNLTNADAKKLVAGKGNYEGAKTMKFKITIKKLSLFRRLFG